MNASAAPALPARVLLAAALAYGLFIYAVLPAGVVACNDDFGYLKSVVQTLQHGRPWTNDWLEPWSASLSAISALLYKATGNFSLAIQGLQSLFAAAAFLGAAALFHARGLPTAISLGCAFLLLTTPVVFWKTVEYTGMTLYLPCLLWALWAAERARWALFFTVWALAVGSRQSAVAWLALPALELIRGLTHRTSDVRGAWHGPALGLTFAAAWLTLLFGGMNTSHAQIARTGAIFWRANFATGAHTFGVGLMVLVVSIGIGAFATLLSDRAPAALRVTKIPAAAASMAVLLGIFAFDARTLISWDVVPLQASMGWGYSKLVLIVATLGWLFVRIRLAPAPLAFALGSLLLLSLRADTYDYYFTDVAFAGLFGVRALTAASSQSTTSARTDRATYTRYLPWALLLGLLPLHARLNYTSKLTLDRAWALCSLYEPALRARLLAPIELRDAPFGYAGWHLHAYSASKGSDTFRRFLSMDRRASTIGWSMTNAGKDEFRPNGPSDSAPPLAEQVHSLGWFREYRFFLRRNTPVEPAGMLGADYRFIPFPLNNAEWRSLIEGPSL